MSERPYMQLYIADYLGDTQHLSCEQHGAYLLLLMAMWRAGGELPNDDKKLARICRLTLGKWRRVKEDVLPFFEQNENGLTSLRLNKWQRGPVRRGVPQRIRSAVFDEHGERCGYCGKINGPFQVDHVFPRSRGGTDDPDNLIVACRDCNQAKGNKTPEEWLQ